MGYLRNRIKNPNYGSICSPTCDCIISAVSARCALKRLQRAGENRPFGRFYVFHFYRQNFLFMDLKPLRNVLLRQESVLLCFPVSNFQQLLQWNNSMLVSQISCRILISRTNKNPSELLFIYLFCFDKLHLYITF